MFSDTSNMTKFVQMLRMCWDSKDRGENGLDSSFLIMSISMTIPLSIILTDTLPNELFLFVGGWDGKFVAVEHCLNGGVLEGEHVLVQRCAAEGRE